MKGLDIYRWGPKKVDLGTCDKLTVQENCDFRLNRLEHRDASWILATASNRVALVRRLLQVIPVPLIGLLPGLGLTIEGGGSGKELPNLFHRLQLLAVKFQDIASTVSVFLNLDTVPDGITKQSQSSCSIGFFVLSQLRINSRVPPSQPGFMSPPNWEYSNRNCPQCSSSSNSYATDALVSSALAL